MRTRLYFVLLAGLAACTVRRIEPATPTRDAAGEVVGQQGSAGLPAGEATVAERLAHSPRHGEWVTIAAGSPDSLHAYVVYPERSTRAPVVVVVHEIFGLSTWVRGVADQLAAEGYIAIAPDLLTGKGTRQGDTLSFDEARRLIAGLQPAEVQRDLQAAARYAMALPAALPRYGIVGFCWGGGISFAHAVESPQGLGAAVVYYGTSPATSALTRVRVPVLGLYGGNDARVDATIPPADSAMKAMGKSYDPHVFRGAGHGFLRAQEVSPANLDASREAWPLTISFFRSHLGA